MRNGKQNRDEHRIFWEFIEEERNNILKKYTFGFVSGDIPILACGEVHVLKKIMPSLGSASSWRPGSDQRYDNIRVEVAGWISHKRAAALL